jgi:hypothetical protein
MLYLSVLSDNDYRYYVKTWLIGNKLEYVYMNDKNECICGVVFSMFWNEWRIYRFKWVNGYVFDRALRIWWMMC